jgi:VanZ family protein
MTLAAGLWPFHSPQNDMTWVPDKGAIHIGENGTALSAADLRVGSGIDPSCSLEIWIEPGRTWTSGSILSFYDLQNPGQFTIRQDFTDLLLDRRGPNRQLFDHRTMRVANVFRKNELLMVITSNGADTSVYINGLLAGRSSTFALSAADMSHRFVVANAPLRDQSWSGYLKGLAFYGTQLNQAAVAEHYRSWMQYHRPPIKKSEQPTAVYLFDETEGDTIHSAIQPQVDIKIPSRFVVIRQAVFETPVTEAHAKSYVKNILINITGFVPLGFAFALCFHTMSKAKVAVVATILVGATTSFAIEYVQSYLPTRYSGMTDIVTNTVGTGIGLITFRTYTAWAKNSNRQSPQGKVDDASLE